MLSWRRNTIFNYDLDYAKYISSVLPLYFYHNNKQTDIETFQHTEIKIDSNIGFHRDKTYKAPMILLK